MSLLLSRDVTDLRSQLNRLFEEGAPAPQRNGGAFVPAVDVSENEREIVLHVELPGFKKEDIDIQFAEDKLRLSGQRKREATTEGEHFHRIERAFGSFARTFQIDKPVDGAAVAASYEDGVLTIRLPKKEAAKPRQIEIQVKS